MTGEQLELDLAHRVEVAFPLVPMDPPSWHLPPFSGKRVRCPKCGIGAGESDAPADVQYHQECSTHGPCYTLYVNLRMDLYNQIGFPEHLDRTCRVCRYQWVEALAALPGGEDD